MNFNPTLVKTRAGYALHVEGAANLGKGVAECIALTLDAVGARYEQDMNYCGGTTVKVTELVIDGVSLVGWWDAYFDFKANEFIMLSDF